MRNRKLEMRLVKDEKSENPVHPEVRFSERAAIIGAYAERIVKQVGIGVAAYVVLDTARKVAVTYATKV